MFLRRNFNMNTSPCAHLRFAFLSAENKSNSCLFYNSAIQNTSIFYTNLSTTTHLNTKRACGALEIYLEKSHCDFL